MSLSMWVCVVLSFVKCRKILCTALRRVLKLLQRSIRRGRKWLVWSSKFVLYRLGLVSRFDFLYKLIRISFICPKFIDNKANFKLWTTKISFKHNRLLARKRGFYFNFINIATLTKIFYFKSKLWNYYESGKKRTKKIIFFCTPGQRIAVALRLLIYYVDFW